MKRINKTGYLTRGRVMTLADSALFGVLCILVVVVSVVAAFELADPGWLRAITVLVASL